MSDEEFRFASAVDAMPLTAYRWATADARAVVLIAHGAAEHALRYTRFARAMNAAGFDVLALDHRGHGKSQGPLGLGDFGAGDWNALVADLAQFIAETRARHAQLPLALFAHSMGSFAAQQLCVMHTHEAASLDALVLSGSTSLAVLSEQVRRSAWQPNAAFEPARTAYDWLSRDVAEVDKYIADPWCGFEAAAERRKNMRPSDLSPFDDASLLARLRAELPVLLLAGDADPLNRKLEGLNMLERRWREAGVQRIDTRYYAGGRHEMLNEINRDEVTRDVCDWLTAVLAA
jgi:alpha-beta hydrolase superfamily lysophospholipase